MAQIKRRYSDQRTKEWKIYGDIYDYLLTQSDILNANSRSLDIHSIFWDRVSATYILEEIEGDKDGMIRTNRDMYVPAIITKAKERLAKVHAKWDSFCKQREDAGFEAPEEWPAELLKDRCDAEARLDIYLREALFLKNYIANYEEKKAVETNFQVLQYGCKGIGRLRDGELAEIDNQKVERVNGLLLIVEKTSPYYGMKASDYRKFVIETYLAKEMELNDQRYQQRMLEIKEKGFSNIPLVANGGRSKVDRETLPHWPEGLKNYLINEDIEK